jgi:hypothetical protein
MCCRADVCGHLSVRIRADLGQMRLLRAAVAMWGVWCGYGSLIGSCLSHLPYRYMAWLIGTWSGSYTCLLVCGLVGGQQFDVNE